MEIRRIVTGHDASGKATVVSAGAPVRDHRFAHIPGMRSRLIWATEAGDPIPLDGADPTPGVDAWLPEPGSTRLLIVQLPPDHVFTDPGFDPAAAAVERAEAQPGLAERFEAESPGMHTTDTVDYALVLDGEPVLELDDGETVALAPGDVVVQNGTRHAWRNPGDTPVTMAFMLVGAARG